MDIKRRLMISNTITLIIPFVITFIVAFSYVFVFSRFFNGDLSYSNFKRLANTRTELLNIGNEITTGGTRGISEEEAKQYLYTRLSSIGGKFIFIKDNDIVAASEDLSKIDIEKSIQETKNASLQKSVEINNMNYILEVRDLVFKDGTPGNVIILAPIGRERDLFNGLLLLILTVFILSFVGSNLIMSYQFSMRILNPISLLKKAASEISSGNLQYEIVEDGDMEIRELCHDFEAMRVQLKDSVNMRMKYDDNRKMLISSISHDLKTPITSIKGYVEGILDGVASTPEKVENYLKTIYSKAQNIDVMIDDLLLYSKLDLNQLPFNFDKTDIVEYFSYCIYETETELAKYNIKIALINELKYSKYVVIDRERMRRVIMNIIDNSRKYMDKEQGQIIISLRETNSSIIIEIKDNGRGIDGEDVNKVFDRFYRGDLARSGTRGSGLGLAIAKQIVEGHGGRIWAVTHGTEGTSILISLRKIMESSGHYEKGINS